MAIHRTAARPLTMNLRPPASRFRDEAVDGLSRHPKELPCKYFYDERGSLLFDRICDLPEYYLTRTELAITRRHAAAMAQMFGPDCLLIEYGSGSSLKTPLLIERLQDPAGYVPVDISREHLHVSAVGLARQFPGLPISPVWTDFTRPFELPDQFAHAARRVVYFPGSTIGNFDPESAVTLMRGIGQVVGPGGGLLIGVDLRKPAAQVEPAYNDLAGVTAAFNLNLLVRINRELGADFEIKAFEHCAFFNERQSRIEMHLVSRRPQVVRIGRTAIEFTSGESIRTECSYKYSRDVFRSIAASAGFEIRQIWMDDDELFSVQYLTLINSFASV